MGDEGKVRNMRACLSVFLLLSMASLVGCFIPQAKAEEGTAAEAEHAKKEIQKYIELVGKNDLENRESAWEETRQSRKNPGWKSR